MWVRVPFLMSFDKDLSCIFRLSSFLRLFPYWYVACLEFQSLLNLICTKISSTMGPLICTWVPPHMNTLGCQYPCHLFSTFNAYVLLSWQIRHLRSQLQAKDAELQSTRDAQASATGKLPLS